MIRFRAGQYTGIVQQHNKNIVHFFDKRIKIGTLVDYHLINIFGYEGAHRCPHGDHSNGF